MKNESKSIIILCFYVIIMVCVLVLSIYLLKNTARNEPLNNDLNAPITKESETQIIYVPIFSEVTTETEIATTSPKTKYFCVKSYGEKIGVFNEDDTLVSVIERHTKTLPKADRELLEKGIVVFSEAQLRAIIEDYTG